MGFSLLERAKEFLRAQRKKNIWYRTMCGLAAVVVFVTTYMLILPAITMERKTICGQEEHTHTETCYEVVTIAPEKVLSCTEEALGIHEHKATCYDSDHNLICGYADFVVHTHDKNCYGEDGKLVCTLTEIKEHGHTASCYQEDQKLTCGQEVSEGHQHSEGCYTNERGSLTCGAEEHTHIDSCKDADGNYICGKEEHIHNDNCYKWIQKLVCTQAESTGNSHTEACYETVKTLTCDKQEVILHTHTEGCYENGTLVCGKLEVKKHQHTEDCFVADGEETTEKKLICGKKEHEHTDACYPVSDDAANVPMLLANNTLPVTKLSGENTSYNPITDLFTTTVRIDFQFDTNTGKPTVGTVYTYTYPEGVTVPDTIVNEGQKILMDGDKNAGTYQFVKNDNGTYSVQVIFDKEYINGSGDTITGYVQFGGSFGKEDLNDKGEIVVGVDDAIVLVPGDKITYPKDETESYNIDVSKSGNWVQDGDNLVYTVYVRTTKGTPNPISLTDTITNKDGLTLGEPSVTVEKGTANYYYHDWEEKWVPTDNNNWSEVSGISPQYSNETLTLSLPSLSAEKGKDSNNYDCIIGDVYKITYTYPITDQTLASVSPENKVTVRAEDTTKGQTVTDEAESTVNVNKDLSYTVDKRGEVASDKPGYIKWTVTVNNNEVDITGAKLTDEMLGLVEGAEDISIAPTAGTSVNKDASGKITDIIFSSVEDGMNKNKYTITYYTPVQESWNGTTVTNKAVLDPKPDETGDEKEVTASVTVNGVKLDKSGAYNGSTEKIDWTITVNEGKLDIAGATLTDDMFAALSQNDFTIEPATGYSFTTDTNGKISGITFSAVEDGKNKQSYTIKYSTAATENADGTINSVTNTATLSPGQGTDGTPVGAESTVTPETVKLTKSGQDFRGNNTINWTITVNEGYRNIAGAVLTDDMFDQLESGTLRVFNENWQEIPDESDQYTINADEAGKITSIVFNAIGETGKNTNKYFITYSTTEYSKWEEHTVHNVANLKLDGKDIPETADVTISGAGNIEKSAGTASVSADGTTLTIPWTVTLNIPKGGLASGTSIVDDVTKNQWNNTNMNQWMTRSQITAWATNLIWKDDNGNTVGGTNTYNPPPEQVTFLASNGNTYTYKQISEYNAPAEEGQVDFEALKYTLFTINFPEGLTPPEGATKLTFTYWTTADVSQAAIGQTKFYNYIKAGEKENSAEYTYYKPGVVKTDGNGNANTTTVTNDGTLTWKIKASMGEGYKKLTLIDTLPSGVTLESLRLTGWGNLDMELAVDNDGVISGTDSTNQYNISGTFNNNVISLDVEPQTTGNTIQTGAEFTLTVTCKVNDAEKQTEMKSLTNTAQMKLDDVEIGSSSQTQEWTYKKEEVVTNVVDKSGGWDNNNRIMNYTVILNKEGKELLDGSDTLTLTDTLSYLDKIWLDYSFNDSNAYSINASLIQSSVKLYEAVWDENQGKWGADKVISNWSWTYEVKTGVGYWDKTTNTITATGIPDGIPLMLQYSYRITSNVPDEQNGKKVYFDLQFTNKATLEGTSHTSESSSSNMKWEYSNASAGVTTEKSYIFYKVEAGNYNVSLAGATFSVYKYNSATNEYESDAVKTYSTNDSGSFHITRQEKDSSGNVTFSYDTNTLYKVVETAPPSGYKLPDVVNTYYFYFRSTEDTTHTLPSSIPSGAVDLSNEAKTVYVENVKNTTEITVQKIWKDSAANVVDHNNGSVTINLYQKTSQGSSSGGNITEEGKVGITATEKNGFDVTSKINLKEVEVGSRIQIRLELNYLIDASWNWTPVVSISGIDGATTEGWVLSDSSANGNSTYSLEGLVTGNVSITCEEESSKIDNIRITVLSHPAGSGNSGSNEEDSDIANREPYKTASIDSSVGWTHTFTDLPLTGTDTDGNTVNYYYYVQEVSVPNYTTSYENNNGIQSGTITVTNQAVENPTFELPETGGPGTRIAYTLGSILMLLASAAFLYIKKRNDGKKGGLA